jgi:hypothetical protein
MLQDIPYIMEVWGWLDNQRIGKEILLRSILLFFHVLQFPFPASRGYAAVTLHLAIKKLATFPTAHRVQIPHNQPVK